MLPYKLQNFGQNLKVAHYWKKHTVLKMAELQNYKNSHYLLTLMSFETRMTFFLRTKDEFLKNVLPWISFQNLPFFSIEERKGLERHESK